MNRQPRGSPASADTCATPRICPARPLPRALATDCACCASLLRPDPCPLPSQHRLNSACLAFWRNCCIEESSGCHLCCACNLVHAHGTTSAGYARVRGIQGTRAGDRGCTADGRIGELPRRPAEMPIESMSTPTIALVRSYRDARQQKSRGRCGARVVCERRQENERNGPRRVESEHTGSAAGARDTSGGGMVNVDGAYHLGFCTLMCAAHWRELRRQVCRRFPCARQRTRKWCTKIGVGKGIFCGTGETGEQGVCGICSRLKWAFRVTNGLRQCTHPSQACRPRFSGSELEAACVNGNKHGGMLGHFRAAYP